MRYLTQTPDQQIDDLAPDRSMGKAQIKRQVMDLLMFPCLGTGPFKDLCSRLPSRRWPDR